MALAVGLIFIMALVISLAVGIKMIKTFKQK